MCLLLTALRPTAHPSPCCCLQADSEKEAGAKDEQIARIEASIKEIKAKIAETEADIKEIKAELAKFKAGAVNSPQTSAVDFLQKDLLEHRALLRGREERLTKFEDELRAARKKPNGICIRSRALWILRLTDTWIGG